MYFSLELISRSVRKGSDVSAPTHRVVRHRRLILYVAPVNEVLESFAFNYEVHGTADVTKAWNMDGQEATVMIV